MTATRQQMSSARTMQYDRLSSCPDMEPEFAALYERVRPFTMTSLERMYGLYKAVEHLIRARVPGDVVECGVWRGGSAMLAALALRQFGDESRSIWLYDTFEGMTAASTFDIDFTGEAAESIMRGRGVERFSNWCRAPLDQARRNMASTGYLAGRVEFVAGDVEETIPANAPDRIALLRLDTDWYDSTRHELKHLYPRLERGGVLIIDDYGHWRGCRRAVDEFMASLETPVLLNRLDYTGRIGVKP